MILSSDVPSRKLGQTFNIGRLVAQRAGLPDSVGGMSCNRFCSSGLQTIAIAAAEIQAGIADVIVAGGVESMTAVPISYETMKKAINPWLWKNKRANYLDMGSTAENVAAKCNITREEMDAFAVESHKKAAAAQDAGHLAASIIPLDGMTRKAIPSFLTRIRGFAAVQPWNPWLLSSLVSKRMAL